MTRLVDKDGYPTVCFVCGERVLSTRQDGWHLSREQDGHTEKLSAHLLCYLSCRRVTAGAA